MAETFAAASTAFHSKPSNIRHEHRIRRQADCHVPAAGSLLPPRSSLSASPLLRTNTRPASSRNLPEADLHFQSPYSSSFSPIKFLSPPPRSLAVRSSMSGGQQNSESPNFPGDAANGGVRGDDDNKSSSPAQQQNPPQSKQSSDSSPRPPPADPQWQDVFPTYLQNRESDLPSKRASPRMLSPGAGSPPRVDRSLGPSSSSPNFALGGTEYPMPYQAQSTTYYSPADISSSRYKYGRDAAVRSDPIWAAIRAEARLEAEQEPILSSFLYASILAHDCFERSLGFVLANRLKNVTLLATQLMDVFDDVLMRNDIREAIRADVQAVRDRDPSCRSYSQALLYYKGFHALQSYRISHALWNRGQKILALALQSRISEVFAVDIHPAARIGQGILMDHGTGVVIGETAVVGNNVSMLQGVTLGGTGKEAGDRHPKVQEGVLIGAGATVLGNISIGRGSMIAAGSLVLKSVPPHSMVAGTPAKVVGTLKEDTPSLTMKHDVTSQYTDGFKNFGDGL